MTAPDTAPANVARVLRKMAADTPCATIPCGLSDCPTTRAIALADALDAPPEQNEAQHGIAALRAAVEAAAKRGVKLCPTAAGSAAVQPFGELPMCGKWDEHPADTLIRWHSELRLRAGGPV